MMAAALAFVGVGATQVSGTNTDLSDNGWFKAAVVVGALGFVVFLVAAIAQALSDSPQPPALNIFMPQSQPQPPSPSQPLATPSELRAQVVKGRTFRLWEAVPPGEKIIFGRAFEDCHITGPMVVYATGCTFDSVTFRHASPDGAVWSTPSDSPSGVLWVQQCVFRRTILEDIGFTGPPKTLDEWRAAMPTKNWPDAPS